MIYIVTMAVAIAVLLLVPLSKEKSTRLATQGLAGLVFAVGLVMFMARLLGKGA